MIEFVSLLLGLLGGSVPVQLNVVGAVAEVEVRLDGRPIETLSGPPWVFTCDLGEALEPHELVAIARDSAGLELDRARQWVNLTPSLGGGASLAFDTDDQGDPRSMRVVWESIGYNRPRLIEVFFDGEPLTVTNPDHIPLPAYDPAEMHFVRTMVHFHNNLVTQLEAGFGGLRSEEVSVDLTAVAIHLEKKTKLPKPRDMQSWFEKAGETIPVHGVDEGPAEVVVVRDPAIQPVWDEMVARVIGNPAKRRERDQRLNQFGWLGSKVVLRVLSPVAARLSPGQLTSEMFPHSDPLDASSRGLLWHALTVPEQRLATRITNTVALAGMTAQASQRRRAVVLLLGEGSHPWDRYSPAMVREFLRLLQVPLFVWSFGGEADTGSEWGEVRQVGFEPGRKKTTKRLAQAIDELVETLEAQRIVWLSGQHLPQDVELATGVAGLGIAGVRAVSE